MAHDPSTPGARTLPAVRSPDAAVADAPKTLLKTRL
jgi:hypothetical protein